MKRQSEDHEPSPKCPRMTCFSIRSLEVVVSMQIMLPLSSSSRLLSATRWVQTSGPLFEHGGPKCRTHGCHAVLAWPCCWKFHPFHLVACCQGFPRALVSANKEIEHGLQKGTRPHRNHHRRGQDVAVSSSSTPRVGRPTFGAWSSGKANKKLSAKAEPEPRGGTWLAASPRGKGDLCRVPGHIV